MKLSLQGTTIIVAAGDYGVTTQPSQGYNGCVNAKSYNPNKNGTVFNPTFPSGCPYVLSVGATQLVQGQNVYDPESAMYIPTLTEGGVPVSSSRGFSNVFKRPTWQDEAVTNYLDNYAPDYPSYVYNGYDIFSGKANIGANGGLYNHAGRGYPDVSASTYTDGQKGALGLRGCYVESHLAHSVPLLLRYMLTLLLLPFWQTVSISRRSTMVSIQLGIVVP